MSYKGLYEYVDYLASLYDDNSPSKVLMLLINFHDIALSAKKFVTQRQYCKAIIYKLNKDFAEGYYKKSL